MHVTRKRIGISGSATVFQAYFIICLSFCVARMACLNYKPSAVHVAEGLNGDRLVAFVLDTEENVCCKTYSAALPTKRKVKIC